jgi:hypothetical protein
MTEIIFKLSGHTPLPWMPIGLREGHGNTRVDLDIVVLDLTFELHDFDLAWSYTQNDMYDDIDGDDIQPFDGKHTLRLPSTIRIKDNVNSTMILFKDVPDAVLDALQDRRNPCVNQTYMRFSEGYTRLSDSLVAQIQAKLSHLCCSKKKRTMWHSTAK